MFGGGLRKEIAVWIYLTGYAGEMGLGGLPQYMLMGPRRGGVSEIRKDCTNPVISCPLFHWFMTMFLNVCSRVFFPSLSASYFFPKSIGFFLTYFATDSLESLDLVLMFLRRLPGVSWGSFPVICRALFMKDEDFCEEGASPEGGTI